MSSGPQASLDLTHVIYDDSSYLSLLLALVTLTPILLMPAYAALAVQTREFLVIVMWAGQWACEGFNWILKHLIKEQRPTGSLGNGYGFPSSHGQYMGYFASFLISHMFFRHEFASTGNRFLDRTWRVIVYSAILVFSGSVAYSRYHLGYHSPSQILWGFAIGAVCGSSLYITAEVLPRRHPQSFLGKFRIFCLSNPVSTWLQIRDGWDIWADGGREAEWERWRAKWDESRQTSKTSGRIKNQ